LRLTGRVQLNEDTHAVLMVDPRYEIVQTASGGDEPEQ
jgi:hypothetical protein